MQNAVAVKRLDTLQRFADPKSTVPSSRPTHYVQDSEIPPIDQDTSYELFMMKDATRDPILITLELNEVPLQMELDTGASLTLINRTSYKKLPMICHGWIGALGGEGLTVWQFGNVLPTVQCHCPG